MFKQESLFHPDQTNYLLHFVMLEELTHFYLMETSDVAVTDSVIKGDNISTIGSSSSSGSSKRRICTFPSIEYALRPEDKAFDDNNGEMEADDDGNRNGNGNIWPLANLRSVNNTGSSGNSSSSIGGSKSKNQLSGLERQLRVLKSAALIESILFKVQDVLSKIPQIATIEYVGFDDVMSASREKFLQVSDNIAHKLYDDIYLH